MEFAEKLIKARKKAGLTQVELAKKLGVTQGTIAQYETKEGELNKDGKIKKASKPTFDKLPELVEILNVDLTYFFSNSNEHKKKIVKKELETNLSEYLPYIPENLQLKDFVMVKKLNFLAGAGSEGVFDMERIYTGKMIAFEKRMLGNLKPENMRAIEIIGDSMEPEYSEGDIALIDMVNNRFDFIKIAGIYIVRCNEAVYIKRVEFLPEGGLRLISINKNYGDIILGNDDNFEILGKVCGKIRYEISKGLIFDNQGIQ